MQRGQSTQKFGGHQIRLTDKYDEIKSVRIRDNFCKVWAGKYISTKKKIVQRNGHLVV